MAHSNSNPVPKLYKSIIEDVIEGVSELFAEEGIDEQVLKELKQLWEAKVMQSKATEGFFRDNNIAPQFVLQLPQNLHQSIHTVLPGGRSVQSFAVTEMSSSCSNTAFTIPAGTTYPFHLPAGMTVQTASGQLYKVTVPVMVTQAPGGPRIIQQPVQQLFQHLVQPSGHTIFNQFNGNSQAGQKQQQQEALVERSAEALNIHKPKTAGAMHLDDMDGNSLLNQSACIQQHFASNLPNRLNSGLEENNFNDMPPPPLFSPSQTELTLVDNSESMLNNFNMTQTVQGQSTNECARLFKSQVSDNVVQQILDDDLSENISIQDHNEVSILEKQLVTHDIEIIQVDGTGDTSSDEEIETIRDVDENEFLGIIDTEDLKALEEDSASNEDSTNNSSDDEDPEIDVIEEDPLNSGDDVSEQEVPDMFDTDNVIVCQYDKIHRSKNKWKFYLKDGVMSFGGKDYVFSKAIGEAEWEIK
ncbi:TFIIA-alpha and beta-like factor isoform X4 [Ascaphus truei]|uniref:TFIIA-alpha and beta-like factor isoform X4 n=1 Tax=Ascaphus truei TaxID=8439 RepID=UPI003F59B99E